MMKKRRLIPASVIVIITAVCILLGFKYNIPDEEKQQGLTGQFDVTAHGEIGYITYEDGKPTILVKADPMKQVVQLTPDKSILDLAMMPDGETVLYIESDKELNRTSGSILHRANIQTGEDEVLFSTDAIVMELAVDPKDDTLVYYLQADQYSAYSPGASLYPHDFDIHQYDLETKENKQLTEFNKYSMASLQVAKDEEAIYIQMDDDGDVQSDEEIFETKGRVFKLPLDKPNQKMVISIPEDTQDLYDFVLIPERSELIYQAVAGTDSDGIFEYELFSYNWETQKIEQLTSLKEYVEHPIYGGDGKVYFVVDSNFAEQQPEHTLFRMNPDGSELEEISLTQ